MAKFGKWLGGGLGWVLGGPIGAILGYAVGSIYDSATLQPADGNSTYTSTGSSTAQGDFSMSLMVLCAAVMRADGRVVKGELDYVKAFLTKNFGEEHAKDRLLLLRELLKQDFAVAEVCAQIRQYMPHPSRLQLLHLLYGLANADDVIDSAELQVIEQIARYMGISTADAASLKAMYYKDADSTYQVLEITADATDEEVKKAYRRMAVKYHPDKVSQLGEDVQRAAKEKFQKLQEAYEHIRKIRGMS
jgi:DnaJ like chaperone protein